MATKEQVISVMRSKMRVQHLAWRTEEAYTHWVGRYFDFTEGLPRELRSERKAELFLSELAVTQGVAARSPLETLGVTV